MDSPTTNKRFNLKELSSKDTLSMLYQDVRQGLFNHPRSLPPKYFYDEVGSGLFDAICNTQDYYPTRTELALLQKHSKEIIAIANPQTCIELGAGTSAKTEVLLSQMSTSLSVDEIKYVSIDVCKEVLVESAQRLLNNYPNLTVHSIVGEYVPAIQALSGFDYPALFAFIGSSIGNFTEQQSIQLLTHVAEKMTSEDFFLIGIDRVKDKQILEQAYDDSEGVTAKFNLNVLTVLNNNLGANFNLNNFSHHAIYNESEQQIEMYLVSDCDQTVNFTNLGESIHFKIDEKILTEISRKYTKASIQQLLEKSGLVEEMHLEPTNEYFSLVLAKQKL